MEGRLKNILFCIETTENVTTMRPVCGMAELCLLFLLTVTHQHSRALPAVSVDIDTPTAVPAVSVDSDTPTAVPAVSVDSDTPTQPSSACCFC